MTRPTGRQHLRLAALILIGVGLSGCVSHTVKTVETTAALEAQRTIPEEELLDVGIRLFDPNVPEDWEEMEEELIFPEVREAEARYIPYQLKKTLESTANWGAVRVVPRDTQAVDVDVSGRIVESDGELLRLHVTVTDATGRTWFSRQYEERASKYAYEDAAPHGVDPFQSLYNQIANDMLRWRQEHLATEDVQRVRQVALMRFAEDFAPQRFDGYVEPKRRGRYELQRLPAEGDPMLDRVQRVRQREYLFLDTLDEYYRQFHGDMRKPYQDYRDHTYEEAVALRELRRQARWQTIAGIAAVATGAAGMAGGSDSSVGRAGSAVAVMGGAHMIRRGLSKRSEAQIHAEALRELGNSLGAEITPSVIQLEDRTVRLTGTVEEQYAQWKDILRELYRTEVEPPANNG